jgi:pSer/pThr/pTyr-binding forkhead associated (FHA) protein
MQQQHQQQGMPPGMQHGMQHGMQPQAMPPMPPPPGAMVGNGKRLVLYYRGQRHEVNKDRFIIGRGKQSSDLTIKDPNVSRQHAMIECLNGQYFMVDMGSTNGIEFNGQRLQRKPIASGDVFNICDHELRFVLE